MRNIFIVLMILLVLSILGCSKPVVDTPAAPAAAPPLTQVNPAAESEPAGNAELPPTTGARVEEPAAASTTGAYDSPGSSVETGAANETLGSRVQGTEKTAVDETVPSESTEIQLFANKTMSEKALTVSAGTTLSWKNYDSWPHVLAIETGKGFDTKRWAKSEQMLTGNVWSYTFNDKGIFLVRDTFSGSMRMNVTVE